VARIRPKIEAGKAARLLVDHSYAHLNRTLIIPAGHFVMVRRLMPSGISAECIYRPTEDDSHFAVIRLDKLAIPGAEQPAPEPTAPPEIEPEPAVNVTPAEPCHEGPQIDLLKMLGYE